MRDHTSDFPKLTFKHYCIVYQNYGFQKIN